MGTDVDSSGVVRSLSLGGLQRDCTHRGPMRPRPRSRPTVSPTFNAKPTPLRGGGGKVDTMRGRTGITPHGRAESLDSPLRESLDVCRSEQSLGSPKNGSRLMVCSIATPDSQSPERPRIHGHGRDRSRLSRNWNAVLCGGATEVLEVSGRARRAPASFDNTPRSAVTSSASQPTSWLEDENRWLREAVARAKLKNSELEAKHRLTDSKVKLLEEQNVCAATLLREAVEGWVPVSRVAPLALPFCDLEGSVTSDGVARENLLGMSLEVDRRLDDLWARRGNLRPSEGPCDATV